MHRYLSTLFIAICLVCLPALTAHADEDNPTVRGG